MNPSFQAAIAILQEIQQKCGSASLAYWTTPNTILTLSGARAYCDGVFWDDENRGLLPTWQKEITESLEVIKAHGKVIVAEAEIREGYLGKSYAGYDLLLEDGLRYVITQTKLVDDSVYSRLVTAGAGEIMKVLQDELAERLQGEGYTEDNIEHIAFGLLVGYPDKAMLQSVKRFGDDRDPFSEPLMAANIRGAGYYVCPQPVYDYPRNLAGDPEIRAHEQLWSSILKGYYTSDFHTSLEKDPAFTAKARETGTIR